MENFISRLMLKYLYTEKVNNVFFNFNCVIYTTSHSYRLKWRSTMYDFSKFRWSFFSRNLSAQYNVVNLPIHFIFNSIIESFIRKISQSSNYMYNIIALVIRCILNRLSDNRVSQRNIINFVIMNNRINVKSIRFLSPLLSIFAKRLKNNESKKVTQIQCKSEKIHASDFISYLVLY